MKKQLLLLALLPLMAACKGKGPDVNNFMLGLGGEGVPVGQYSSQILKHFNIDEEKLNANGHVSYGANVGEVANHVKQGMVAAGMIYKTDAFTYDLKIVDHATSEMCDQVIYPVAVMSHSTKKDAAKSFLSYLRTQAAMSRFEAVGFTGMNKLEEALPQVSDPVTLNVYAATSMTASLNQVIEDYKTVASNVTIVANFGSSGALQTQIQQGGDCDVFISAAQKQMNNLANGGFVETETRVNFLENQVVLSVPEANPYNLTDFASLVSILDQIDN